MWLKTAILLVSIWQVSLSKACPSTCTCKNTRVICYNKVKTQLPADIPADTTYLSIEYGSLKQIPDDYFSNLKNLTGLRISNGSIKVLSNRVFRNLTNLKNLYIINGGLRIIGTKSFYNLPQLKYLDLQNNTISRVSPQSFKRLPNLTHLIISGNRIGRIVPGMFCQVPVLTVIYMPYNTFKRTPFKTFSNLRKNRLPKLSKIYLRPSRITCNCQMVKKMKKFQENGLFIFGTCAYPTWTRTINPVRLYNRNPCLHGGKCSEDGKPRCENCRPCWEGIYCEK